MRRLYCCIQQCTTTNEKNASMGGRITISLWQTTPEFSVLKAWALDYPAGLANTLLLYIYGDYFHI